jgi:hypothetical protein
MRPEPPGDFAQLARGLAVERPVALAQAFGLGGYY